MTVCIHDDSPDTCPPCRNIRNPRERYLRKADPWELDEEPPELVVVEAQYEGICLACGEIIFIGQVIEKKKEGWVHGEC